MSSWDSRTPTSAAVAEDLSVPIPPQPFSLDAEGRSTHFLRNIFASVGCQTGRPSPIGQVAIKLALSFGVAIGQYEKNGLYLLLIFDIAFCLVTLVHCALVVDSATGVHC